VTADIFNCNRLFALPALLLVLLCGCGKHEPPPPERETQPQAPSVTVTSAQETPTRTGDLETLQAAGELRILVQRSEHHGLPRIDSPLDDEREMAAGLARELNLEPIEVFVDDFDQLIPALLTGQGDLVAANLTLTASRRRKAAFTVPTGHATEQIVGRTNEPACKHFGDLSGRAISVKPGSSFHESLEQLRKTHPGIQIKDLPASWSLDQTLDALSRGEIDLTVADSNRLTPLLRTRTDIKPLLNLTVERVLAWAIRPDNTNLLAAANRYLNHAELARKRAPIRTGDLTELRRTGTLRMLTRNNASTYFIWKGRLLGFEYEMAQRFAHTNQMHLEVVVADTYEDLIPMLKQGRGDFIAAFMTITPERKQEGITFSRPYHYASELLVARNETNAPAAREDLANRTVTVRKGSSYEDSLRAMQDNGIDVKIAYAPPAMETEEIIAHVADGTYDLTVADGQIVDIEMTWRSDIQSCFPLGDPIPHGWAVRADNPDLLAAINRFLKKEYKGLYYNILYKKYFKNTRSIQSHQEQRADTGSDGTLSPYDDLVKKHTAPFGFDWRLVVAQMYQESRFDPNATSWSGAQGLMQLLPRTAHEFGFDNLDQPAVAIEAGVTYLDWLRDRFEPELDVQERMWFVLASYNAGYGHVQDARRLAESLGLNPNRWFNHTERAMNLLARPQYASKAKYGYVRGSEPVKYVRQIADRYHAYTSLIP
jgi:membrane-bound lytic murein transglycosylase F